MFRITLLIIRMIFDIINPMSNIEIRPVKRLKGTVTLPGDKSISHRAVIVASIAEGKSRVENFLASEDVLRTIDAFKAMGVEIEKSKTELIIHGRGLRGLISPDGPIYLGNSGTSMRLILGILAGQPFRCELTGDESLSRRPMKRVTHPLRLMGAKIEGRQDADFAPLIIEGGGLSTIDYKSPIASAQVKSAILLAGLYADGKTQVTELIESRDHTERMLKFFGAELSVEDTTVGVKGPASLKAKTVEIPGDISSGAFFMVCASLLKGSKVTLQSVGLNPTRSGVIDVLSQMGARLSITRQDAEGLEPKGDIEIEGGTLRGTRIGPDMIPRIIDELPVLMVAASLAEGETIIEGAKELRVKETDRISSMVENLLALGGQVKEREDGVLIHGQRSLRGGRLNSFSDHRTAMSMVVAGLLAEGKTVVEDTDCIQTSFPGFMETFKSLFS